MTNGEKFIDVFGVACGTYDEKNKETTIQLKGDWWDKEYCEPEEETVTEFADRCRECGAKYGKLLKQKIGHCKDCKYFEYDSIAKVDGIPLIVAHEICKKWGDGCKTNEDGYCFLYEPQESEE